MKQLFINDINLIQLTSLKLFEYIQQCIRVVYNCEIEMCDKRLFFDHIKMSQRIEDYGDIFYFGDIRLPNNDIIEIFKQKKDDEIDEMVKECVKMTMTFKDGSIYNGYFDNGELKCHETQFIDEGSIISDTELSDDE
jgi:hypothetical protein